MKKNRKQLIKILLSAALLSYICLAFILAIPFFQNYLHPARYIKSDTETIEISIPFEKNGEVDETNLTLKRGEEVRLRESGDKTSKVEYGDYTFEIDNDNLADSLDEAVFTEYIYPRRLINLRTCKDGTLSDVVAKKGEKLKVVSANKEDLDKNTGRMNWYEVEKDGKKYWIKGTSVELTKENATKDYGPGIDYSTYWDDYYGKGYSEDAYINQIDYKSIEHPNYKSNPLKEDINAIHINLQTLINRKEDLLNLKEKYGVNAICVELKGDGGYYPYATKVTEKYLPKDPTAPIINAQLSVEDVGKILKEYQDEGFYMIGRFVSFKDSYFSEQNPEESLSDKNGNLYLHNDVYWPSPYSRKAWMYVVDAAKEMAPYLNEVQFDYVRFPDGTLEENLDGNVDFKNKYNESKVAALQGFLTYAKEELEPYEVYVAADLFAWPIIAKDDQDIGQFMPALANAVDVISPMPYTDHLSDGAMGITDPYDHPYEVMNKFSKIVKAQLKTMESSPVYRTWITAYGTYGPEEMSAQIDGINDAGFEGYICWSGFEDFDVTLERYKGLRDSSLENRE